MKQLIEKQKDLFTLQQPFSVKMRITHLQNLKAAIKAQEDAIYKALDADLRRAREAFMTEVGLVYEEINHAIKHLKKWAAPKKVKISLAQFPRPKRGFIVMPMAKSYESMELPFSTHLYHLSGRLPPVMS